MPKDEISIVELEDGSHIVEFEGEATTYSKEDVEEMERDYKAAIVQALGRSAK